MNATGGRDMGGNTDVKIAGTLVETDTTFTEIWAYFGNVPISPRTGKFVAGGTYGFSDMYSYDLKTPDGVSQTLRSAQNVVDGLSGYQGLAGGNALPQDLENLLYPDLGLKPNTRPRLTGDARPMQPNATDPNTFRDTWLEAAVEDLCAKKKRTPMTVEERTAFRRRGEAALKKRSQTRTSPIKDCTVPQDVLTPIASANFTVGVTIEGPRKRRSWNEAGRMWRKEVAAGHICRDAHGVVCVTPDLGPMPRIVPRQHQQSQRRTGKIVEH